MTVDLAWPSVTLEDWMDTREAVHLWTQMIGKVKLERCPFVNEWWQVGLELTARGLSSGLIPDGRRSFEIVLDLVDHRLRFAATDGRSESVELRPIPIASFFSEFRGALERLGVAVPINPMPSEVPAPIAFDEDHGHAAYDPGAAARWWQAMLSVERVLARFRTGFTGKSSPILYYWGGCDLNHTRFNGRRVAPPADADPIMRFGEDEENIALGFWPGSREAPAAVLYAYASPVPPGLADVAVKPAEASFVPALGELVLPYEAVRASADPDASALEFFRSAYAGCAACAGWDRSALEGATPASETGGRAPSRVAR